ncbi:hypothetical protein [Thermomonospora umbrina]|uniref:Uncharacterized protein n=1 Tax=Thermomonospora umbrina TaxID=111806 RepID=A0A3D9SWM2_9ACTN|nr:hypothetical protein [Thermomonospora umbrina]REF00350.1 hypothetical protein DFJ69_5882 [Thermomonospora umbrina]
MTFISRIPRAFLRQTVEPATPSGRSDDVMMRFLTVGGATVTTHGTSDDDVSPSWTCHGCDQGGGSWFSDLDARLKAVRAAANKHAGECRAMPKLRLSADADQPETDIDLLWRDEPARQFLIVVFLSVGLFITAVGIASALGVAL